MMMLPRKSPSLTEERRDEIVEDLTLRAAPGGKCATGIDNCK